MSHLSFTDSLSQSSTWDDNIAPLDHSLVHSPLTQSLPSTDVEDEEQEQEEKAAAPPRLHSIAQLAEQMHMLQAKVERLQAFHTNLYKLDCFDDDDVALVHKELSSTELKLEAIKASVQQRDVVHLHVTLKQREAFLENAVRQYQLNPEKDKALFHALVKKQVYLTRLVNNRVSSQQ